MHVLIFYAYVQAKFSVTFNLEDCVSQYVKMGVSVAESVSSCGQIRPDADYALVTHGQTLMIRFFSANPQTAYVLQLLVRGKSKSS